MIRIRYYIRLIKWLWKHRKETPCRQKYKRMAREVDGLPQSKVNKKY